MKRLGIGAVFGVLAVGGLALWGYMNIQPVSGSTKLQDFLITRGSSAGEIGENLKDAGLIRNALIFKFYVQATGKQKRIQAGDFRLSSSYSLPVLVNELLKGPVEVWVTVPEGLRREEIAQKYIQSLGVKNAQGFFEEFMAVSKGQEGSLFPDTYLFAKDVKATNVVNKMLSTFGKRVDAQMTADIEKSGYSETQVLTMASILERETKTDAERPTVAGILYKRLKAGWPLQADATLQYAVATAKSRLDPAGFSDWWRPLTKDDIGLSSLYNTYKNPGLPPAPIANAGMSSIRAAIYPQDSPYWFYIHDTKGQIHYAKTIEEHNQNIRQYLGK